MTGPATIVLTNGPDTFVAEDCHVDRGLVTARGFWRRRLGANFAEVEDGPRRAYTWPARRIHEIRWATGSEA